MTIPFSRGSTWLDWRRHGRILQGCYLCPTSVVSYRGIPDHVDLLQPRNIFDIHWHSRIYIYFSSFFFFEHLLSYTIWIYVIHPDGHGLAKRLSGATEWESLLNGFSVLSHFIVTVLWTLLRNLYKMVPVILQHFFDISTKWFYPKNNIWHHMINISFLPLY